jgi:hypothetical protein
MRRTGLRIGKLHSERLVPLDPDAVELVRRLQPTGAFSRLAGARTEPQQVQLG